MSERHVTAAELEAALEALQQPGRFEAAERLVGHLAPGLHGLLVDALASGGWGPEDDLRQLERILSGGDSPAARVELVNLISEQTRVAMFVGVAIGVELARELGLPATADAPDLQIQHHVQGGPS